MIIVIGPNLISILVGMRKEERVPLGASLDTYGLNS